MKPHAKWFLVKWFLVILLTSTLGFWIFIFLIPDGALSLGERTLWLAACVMTLPTWPLFLLHDPQEGPVELCWLAAYTLTSAVFWPFLLLSVRSLWKQITEPAASPNGGPAEPLGTSSVGGGPPSMS
jgi:hypothetical protein